jgi:hypothetical protein
MRYPSLQDLNTNEESVLSQIEGEIANLPTLKAKLAEAQAQLQASPYVDAKMCRECEGEGRAYSVYSVGYDEYDHDEELCDHCVCEGVYPWDTNQSWFDQEAAEASIDPTLDEDEREDALHDLFMEQAWEADMIPPQVVQDYDRAYNALRDELFSISQNLEILDHHYETKGGGNQEWVATRLQKINEIIEEFKFDSREGLIPRG